MVLLYKKVWVGLPLVLLLFYEKYDSQWIGWPGIESDECTDEVRMQIQKELSENNCRPVFLSNAELDNYYLGYSNKTLWPTFHYFPQYTVFDDTLWESYISVNRKFADEIASVAKENDIIWIHDYHLMLLPKMLRERVDNLKIGFFLHIPFPAYEMFSILPSAEALIDGLLGADLIGFHTYEYVLGFLNSVLRIKGLDSELGMIHMDSRVIKADIFPISIDYEKYANSHLLKSVNNEIKNIRNRVGDKKIILSVDRLDYTKGIYNRLLGFYTFLKENPNLHGKLTLVLVVVPSRTEVESYAKMKMQIDEIVGKIEGEFGTLVWIPIWYLYKKLDFETLSALYNIANIGLVTPLRDGMNLIAKEFVAAKQTSKGVLILSKMAGSSQELAEAILINPNDITAISSAIKTAYVMDENEQQERMHAMQKRIKRYDILKWSEDFIENLELVHTLIEEHSVKRLHSKTIYDMIKEFMQASQTLILLDYDGTMISFSKDPTKAKPDQEVLDIITCLNKLQNVHVVIISGRDKQTLSTWFKGINVSLIAEHGVWIKDKDEGWKAAAEISDSWKPPIREIMEIYVDRTPGTFIEEKDYSLVWHYRNADTSLAKVRVNNLKNVLEGLTKNIDIEVVEGSKIVEVKKMGIDKGSAAKKWLEKKKWDFIFAAGDDKTDEDMFKVLPTGAYSIKVGMKGTEARFSGATHQTIRKLLKKMIQAKE